MSAYKNFNLFVLGTGNKGGDGLKNNNYFWVSGDLKYSDVVLNRWTESTKATATYPRLSSQQSANNFRNSDFWLYKTDRFNLSKVQLTYNLPDNVLGKTFVKGSGDICCRFQSVHFLQKPQNIGFVGCQHASVQKL